MDVSILTRILSYLASTENPSDTGKAIRWSSTPPASATIITGYRTGLEFRQATHYTSSNESKCRSWEGDWKLTKHWDRVDDRDIAEVECLPELNEHMPTVHSPDNIREN